MVSKTELITRLRGLHHELASINDDLSAAQSIDEDTVDALSQLMADVRGLVEHTEEMTDSNKEVVERNQLLDRIYRFESEHPVVSRFLSQLADSLSMMGI